MRQVELADAGDRAAVTLHLWRRGGIGGRVLDEAGEPMVGVPVAVIARVTDAGGIVAQVAARATTDDRGMYHADVPPGDYLVAVLAATTTVPASAVAGFARAQAEGGAGFESYMSSVSRSGGVLPRGVGTRVGPLMVSQFGNQNAPVVPPMAIDGDRAWFYPSTYHPASVSPAGASVVAIGSGEERSGVDVLLRPVPALRISGRLVGPDGPVAGVAVRLVSADTLPTRTSPTSYIDLPLALTDAGGEFAFLGVAPGTYTLAATRLPAAATDALLWGAESVSIRDENVTGIDLRLQTGAHVSGRIVFEGGSQPPPAPAIANMVFGLRPVPGTTGALAISLSINRADPDLRFTTRQVIPGPHVMDAGGLPAGWVLKSIIAGGEDMADRPVDVGPAGLRDVVITLTRRVTSLSGIVRSADGGAAPLATVVVFPVDTSLWRIPAMSSRRTLVAAPGRDGRFTFPSLPAGEYFVVAAEWPGADFTDSRILAALMPTATRLTLGEGESRTVDLRAEVRR